MLGFDIFETALKTICRIETMHMIRKGRLKKFSLPSPRLSFLINLWGWLLKKFSGS